MQRVTGANFLANGNGAGKNAYQDYNPATGQAGTTPNASALNALQEEIAGFIEAQGEALDPNNNAQLTAAIAAYVTAQLQGYETVAAAASNLAQALATLETEVAAQIASALTPYAPLSAFGQSLGINGYQKMPGGLILQWGSVTGEFTQGLQGPYTFPVPFPNSNINLHFTTISPDMIGDDTFKVPVDHLPNSTQFYAWCSSISGGTDRASGFYWWAIGN